MSPGSAYAVLVAMMLQLPGKQSGLASRGCVSLGIWAPSYSGLAPITAPLDHGTGHEGQRL